MKSAWAHVCEKSEGDNRKHRGEEEWGAAYSLRPGKKRKERERESTEMNRGRVRCFFSVLQILKATHSELFNMEIQLFEKKNKPGNVCERVC